MNAKKALPAVLLSVASGVVLAAAGIGVAQMLRRAPIRRIEGRVPPPRDPGFPAFVEATLGAPLQPGSPIELLQNGDGVFPAMWEDMKAARRSISVHSFFWREGELTAQLIRILADRARAGVQVRVLYDGIGAIGQPGSAFDELRAAGADVVHLRPPLPHAWHSVHRRSHARYVLVDDEIAYTGGFGFADAWMGSGRRKGEWRDTAVRVEGPLARALGSGFRSLWAEASGVLVAGRNCANPSAPVMAMAPGAARSVAIHSSPTTVSTAVERLFALTLAAAVSRLYITVAYFVPDRFIVELLARAVARGVDVRILTACEDSDLPVVWWAGRACYEPLLRSGVRIYEYQPSMMHAKTIVVDGFWSLVGAANLDNQSLTNLDESMVGVLDGPFGEQMESVFLDDLKRSREIRLETFMQRPARDRLRERLASSVAILL